MNISDYVYTNYKGDIAIDNDGFVEDLTSKLLCLTAFGKEHIKLIEKILGYEK